MHGCDSVVYCGLCMCVGRGILCTFVLGIEETAASVISNFAFKMCKKIPFHPIFSSNLFFVSTEMIYRYSLPPSPTPSFPHSRTHSHSPLRIDQTKRSQITCLIHMPQQGGVSLPPRTRPIQREQDSSMYVPVPYLP